MSPVATRTRAAVTDRRRARSWQRLLLGLPPSSGGAPRRAGRRRSTPTGPQSSGRSPATHGTSRRRAAAGCRVRGAVRHRRRAGRRHLRDRRWIAPRAPDHGRRSRRDTRRQRARVSGRPGDSGAVRHTLGDCPRRGWRVVRRGHRQSRGAADHAGRHGRHARRRWHPGRRRRIAPHDSTGPSVLPSTAPAG